MRKFAKSFLAAPLSLALLSCAEQRSPIEPLSPAQPALTIVPPAVSAFDIPLTSPYSPAWALTALPTYNEPVIVLVSVFGRIDVIPLHPSKGPSLVDASGYWREESVIGCYVNVQVKYGSTVWPSGCAAPQQQVRSDTILVQGSGTVKRGGAIGQWDSECDNDQCWAYGLHDGVQTLSITPLAATIDLTTPGTSQPSPGYIDRPPPATWAVFRIAASPTTLKSITVPIRVLSWQWIAATGGAGQTVLTGGATAIQRSAYITENGRMIVSAVVNGLEQVDTVRVGIPPDTTPPPPDTGTVTIVPAALSVYPTIILHPPYRERYDTSRVDVIVSVRRADGTAIPNRDVTLSLTPTEGSAGHLHLGPPAKPAGLLEQLGEQAATIQINTGNSGIDTVKFRAPAPSGPVTINGVSGGSAPGSATIDVKVPDLASYSAGVGFTLIGGDTHGGKHSDNHYATQSHISNLQRLAEAHFAKFGKVLQYNDASLKWGGLFDYNWEVTPWSTPHGGHREGLHTDLRTIADPQNGLDALSDRRKKFVRDFWSGSVGGKVREEGSPPHYHLDNNN